MPDTLSLDQFLTEGINDLVGTLLKAALRSPRQAAFLTRFLRASHRAGRMRALYARQGRAIPPFLIASITNRCNLRCKGCYAQGGCGGQAADGEEMTAGQWGGIFSQAKALGICFILLAGGEPLLRPDVLDQAAREPDILFPVFTNGLGLTDEVIRRFDSARNLVPVLSIEGGREETDARRGDGVYDALMRGMDKLSSAGILFGASVTVTKENLSLVSGDGFIDNLRNRGCRALVYVEYVPVGGTQALAPGDGERALLADRLARTRARCADTLVLSFPGDEEAMGGCLAAGRGFFHINAMGGAEPCPFSPFSDTSLLDTPLIAALDSPLFTRVRDAGALWGQHEGGCVLFDKQEEVKKLLE